MCDLKYEVTQNGWVVKGNDSDYTILEVTNFEPELSKRYKELLSQKHDLERAKACLKQMFFTRDTTLIDGALINTSIQLLIRCFTKSGKNDRIKFDESKVFKTYAIEIGELDLSRTYLQFYNARNKVISHDELNYSNNVIGITIDTNGIACDITHLTVATKYVYTENKDLLLRLIHVASMYCDQQLEQVKQLLIDKFNQAKIKPTLTAIGLEHLAEFDAFNIW